MVQGLQHDARTEGPVADDRHGSGGLRRAAAGHRHERMPGDAACGAAGVAGEEQVVVAFHRVGIAHQSAAEADGVEIVVAAGNQLVRIDLMARVPDQAIAAEVERGVQRQRELDHAQVGGEVRRPPRCQAARASRISAANCGQLLQRKPLQVARGVDRGKNLVHQRFLSRT